MQACFFPADILLPDAAADFEKWAVVACDQFTSQPEYWRKAAEIVGDAPSTLNLVYPEAYLAEGERFVQNNELIEAVGLLEAGSATDPDTGFVSLLRLRDTRVERL